MHVSTNICNELYEDDLNNDMMDIHESITELNNHSNMVVIGHNSQTFSRSGWTVQIKLFTPDYQVLPEVPIVDVVIIYECPLTINYNSSVSRCTVRSKDRKQPHPTFRTQRRWDRG